MAARGTVLDRFVTEFVFRTNRLSLRRLDRQIAGIRQRLNRASTFSLGIGAAAAAPLGLIGRKAITVSAAMNRLEAATQANNEQLDTMKQLALDVGSKLPLMTADIIEGMRTYKKLGNPFEDVVKATPALARFAHAADQVSFDDAARYAAVINNTFKVGADGVGLVLDQMLKAETITAGSARGIGEAFQFSAQSAADARMETSEYIALLGVVAGAGRDVEGVSQGLQTFLSQMSKGLAGVGRGGKMIEKIFDTLGIAKEELRGLQLQDNSAARILKLIRDRALNLEGAGGGGAADVKSIIADGDEALAEAMAGQDVLTAVLTQLVGTSYASAFSFLAKNAEELIRVEGEVADAAGESSRQSAVMMQHLSGAWEEAVAMVDTLQVAISDLSVGAPLERMLRGGSKFIQWMLEVNEQGELVRGWVPKAIGDLLLFGTTFLGLGVAIRGVSFALGGFHAAYYAVRWARVIARKKKLAGAFGMIRRPILALMTPVRVLGALFAGLFSWPGLVIAGAAAAAYGVYRNWEPIKEFFQDELIPDKLIREQLGRLDMAFQQTRDNFNNLRTPATWLESILSIPDVLNAATPLMTTLLNEVMTAGERGIAGLFGAVLMLSLEANRALWTSMRWADREVPRFIEAAARAAGMFNQFFIDAWNGVAVFMRDSLVWAFGPFFDVADLISSKFGGGSSAPNVQPPAWVLQAAASAARPLPVGPSQAASTALSAEAAAGTSSGAGRSASFNVERLEVIVPNGDAEDIAERIHDEMGRTWRKLSTASDSQIDR